MPGASPSHVAFPLDTAHASRWQRGMSHTTPHTRHEHAAFACGLLGALTAPTHDGASSVVIARSAEGCALEGAIWAQRFHTAALLADSVCGVSETPLEPSIAPPAPAGCGMTNGPPSQPELQL